MKVEKVINIIIRRFTRLLRMLKLNFQIIFSQLKLRSKKVKFKSGTYGNGFLIRNIGTIILGEKVFLHSFPNGSMHRTALLTYYSNSTIIIGNNCRLNGTIIHCNERVEIGQNCLFGPGTVIVDNDSHRILKDALERRKKPASKPIKIMDNVWIGMNCIVLKGVVIGENSIIAAGSIITKDIPHDSVFGGNPARLIKTLD